MNSRCRRFFSFILLFSFLWVGKAFALEVSDILGLVSWNCIDLRVIGACGKPPGIPGIMVMYWEPALLIETVKKPGDTVIGSLASVVSSLTREAASNFASTVTGLSI